MSSTRLQAIRIEQSKDNRTPIVCDNDRVDALPKKSGDLEICNVQKYPRALEHYARDQDLEDLLSSGESSAAMIFSILSTVS